MDLKIKGRTAVVTGGTRGIGRAIVETFAAEGANVAFCARDKGKIDEVAAAVASTGVKVRGTVLDVADHAAVKTWVEETAVEFGGIDMVVSNVSALAIPDTWDNWRKSVEVDLLGTVALVNASLPYLETSQQPSIVAISSVSGREADFASGPYGTVKSALIGYMAGLALRLADKGIRANTVSPGNTYHEDGVWQQIESGDPGLFATAVGLNPTGEMGRPQEVANGVVFLSSPASARTNGANLLIDGALTRGIQF